MNPDDLIGLMENISEQPASWRPRDTALRKEQILKYHPNLHIWKSFVLKVLFNPPEKEEHMAQLPV